MLAFCIGLLQLPVLLCRGFEAYNSAGCMFATSDLLSAKRKR